MHGTTIPIEWHYNFIQNEAFVARSFMNYQWSAYFANITNCKRCDVDCSNPDPHTTFEVNIAIQPQGMGKIGYRQTDRQTQPKPLSPAIIMTKIVQVGAIPQCECELCAKSKNF